jgi:hypothetical protein
MVQRRLEVVIVGDAQGAKDAFNDTEKGSEGLADKMKSALGGAGVAVAAGAVAGLAGIGVALKGAYEAAVESQKISNETERVIRTTGSAANITADQVGDLAGHLSDLTGIDDEVVQGAENLLLTFTNVKNEVGEGNDVFSQATGLALDMSTALGTDASGAAIQLGKALNDPVKGITALSKAGVSFTEQQKDQIKEMVKAGDVLGAQKVVLAELSKEFGGAAEAAGTPLEKLQVKIGNFQEAVGARLIPVVDAAATWLGDQLPGAIEKATGYFEELTAAVGPVARGAFDALSSAVQSTTGVLSQHVEVIRLLATGGFVYLASQIIVATAAYGELAAVWVAIQWSNVSDLVLKFAVALQSSAASGTLMTDAIIGLRAAMFGLNASVGLAGVALAAISVVIYGAMTAADEGRKSADAFIHTLEDGVDRTNLMALNDELATVNDRIEAVGHQATSMGDRAAALADVIVPFSDIENSVNDAYGELDRLREKQQELQRISEESERVLWNEARALTGTGLEAGALHDRLTVLASAGKIDLTADGAQERLHDLAIESLIAQPPLLQLQQSFKTVADQTSNAEEKAKAYKEALDALIGVELGAWDAGTKATQAMKGLADAHITGKASLDLNTASAKANNDEVFKNRDALSGAISSSISHAQAVFNESGSLQQANAVLGQHREQLVTVLTQLLGNRAAAESYINQLGLTPENINTLVQLNPQDAPQKLSSIQGQINRVGQGATVTIDANITPAEANLNRLGYKISDLERRVFVANVSYDSGARPHADGGIELFAGGGLRESHIAQIAPAGAMRLWAEPETGGEAYIPLGRSKRARSTQILAQVADMFGYEVQAPGAGGGRLMRQGAAAGGSAAIFNFYGVAATKADVGRALDEALREYQRSGGTLVTAG